MTVGVAVMAYGSPATYEDVESFYTDVRRGRPPAPEQLEELKARYAAVGGTSSLVARTHEQVEGIQAALEREAPGRFVCRFGAKHSSPRIEDAVAELAGAGVESLVGIVLAPHYSLGSVGEYLQRAGAAAEARRLPARFVEDWHTDPVLIDLLVERAEVAFSSLGVAPGDEGSELLVTAHSLPIRVIEAGDTYDVRLEETGRLIAGRVRPWRWRICWQSAGRTPEPWLGPDIREVIASLPDSGVRAVVVCPAGFTSDHLEVNYDVDIEARAIADKAGLALARTSSLNAEPRLCAALARLVAEAAEGG